MNVRIARCRWFDSVIFTLCTSVRVPDDVLDDPWRVYVYDDEGWYAGRAKGLENALGD